MSFKTLNIGSTSLIASQLALNTVGHNISNAATPGYTRQRLKTAANIPDVKTFGALGSGTLVQSIRRVSDEFLDQQVREANGLEQYYSSQINSFKNMEAVFNELSKNDISSNLDAFWNSINDVNNNVADISTRRAFIQQSLVVKDAFQGLDNKIRDMRVNLNNNVKDIVGTVNNLLKEVSTLNQDILKTEKGGTSQAIANDSRDQRTERLKELGKLLDITVSEESSGADVVSLGGRLLVFENQTFELTTETTTSGDMLIDNIVFKSDSDQITPGKSKIGAFIEMRDTTLLGYKNDLDQLAGSFLWEFNRVHSQGLGLKGYSSITSTNAVIDPTAKLNNLTYDFTPVNGTFNIQNGNFELKVINGATNEISTLNIEVDLDNTGEPDTILYDSTNPPPAANNALVNKIQNALDAQVANTFNVSIDTANHITITSSSANYTLGFGRDTSGLLAALGFNNYFSGYDAGSIDVEQNIQNNPDLIAGAKDLFAGNNENIIDLMKLRNTKVLSNNTATLDDFYQGIIGRLGIETAQKISLQATQKDIVVRLENQREEVAGVNIDEEMTLMIKFQRSFQASAKFISIANSMYDTLIKM